MKVSHGNVDTIDAYSRFSDEYFDSLGAEGDAGRRLLLNPAIFRLLGEVRGRAILDAGCGHGYLSRLLAERGATVVGVEPATVPFRYAVRTEEDRRQGITYLQRDLAALGDPGRRFDAVVANMVLLNIPDWQPAMANCVASLRVGGVFIYSLHHPLWTPGTLGTWAERGVVEVTDYLNEHEQLDEVAPNFHRPLSVYINETINLGCTLIELVEPGLRPDQVDRPQHEILTRIPNFILIAARRDH